MSTMSKRCVVHRRRGIYFGDCGLCPDGFWQYCPTAPTSSIGVVDPVDDHRADGDARPVPEQMAAAASELQKEFDEKSGQYVRGGKQYFQSMQEKFSAKQAEIQRIFKVKSTMR